MFFRRKKDAAADQEAVDGQSVNGRAKAKAAEASGRSAAAAVSTAETAHLVGPGCVRLQGRLPVWTPVDGTPLKLHPRHLRRLLCYGNVDLTTATLRLFWKRGIQVVFLSPHGDRMLGKLQPGGRFPNLQRLQHLTANDAAARLRFAREVVDAKLVGCLDEARYFQQQGRGDSAGVLMRQLRAVQDRLAKAVSVDAVRGHEGAAAARWFPFLGSLLPPEWRIDRRVAHPPTDRTNALLSLGYSLAYHRCETLLAAADLDPRVGFLHDIHPGRSSLACDLMEPLRATLVDRLVIRMVSRRELSQDDFTPHGPSWRLTPGALKRYLAAFEEAFEAPRRGGTLKAETIERIEAWSRRFRETESADGEAK
ncbi:MAG: CRISPR-associated endonuclease Cas1 [Planctomycetaceae bacterium]|nr:MAG: CRISPR-associated endonuclease Cas1 [Planctomycetaceae bacterium]